MERNIKLLLFLMYSMVIYAQDNDSYDTQNILPASPDVAGLYKYVATPVSYYTGIPNINIPLYTLQGIEGGMNINLSYHSGGIKVSEESGSVGLGWSLNAGGVITRSISGRDDFGIDGYLITPSEVNKKAALIPDMPFSYDGRIGQPYILRSSDCMFEVNGEPVYYPKMHPNRIDASEFGDWMPDTFSFNFDGYSGKFWMDQYGEHIITDQNNGLKIRMIGFGGGFEIITPNGKIYEFLEIEYTSGQLKGESGSRLYVSSWFLSKITDSKGDTVAFHYSDQDFQNAITPTPAFTQYHDPLNKMLTFAEKNIVGKTFRIFERYLKEITTSKERVVFNHSEQDERLDIGGSFFIKSIDVFSNTIASSEKIKNINFAYSYFGSERIGSTSNLTISRGDYRELIAFGSDPFLRLKLDNITVNGTKDYDFEYYDASTTQNLITPSKTSFSQDYWGFYNGKVNTNSFIPVILDPEMLDPFYSIGGVMRPIGIPSNIDLADRRPYEFHTKFGLLTKITYPTKGYTEFDYEPNTFYGDLNKTSGYTIPTTENLKNASNSSQSDRLEDYTEVKFTPQKKAYAKVYYSVVCFRKGDYGFEYPQYSDINASITAGNGYLPENTEVYNFHRELQDIGGHTAVSGTVHGFSETVNTVLEPGVEYTLKCQTNETQAFSSQASIRVEYYESQEDNEDLPAINKGGGVRIKSISNYDNNSEILTKREFDYHYTDNGEEKSYGKTIRFPEFASHIYRNMGGFDATIDPTDPVRAITYDYVHPVAMASSQPAISPFQGSYVGYDQVIESFINVKDASKNGETIYKYHNDIENELDAFYPQGEYEEVFEQFPQNRNPINGLLYEKKYLKSENNGYTLLKKENFDYKINGIDAHDFYLHKIYDNTNLILGACLINELNINPYAAEEYLSDIHPPTFIQKDWCQDDYFLFYPYYSHLTQKASEVVTDYDENGENPVITTTTFEYDNEYIPTTATSVKVTNSQGQIIENKTYYPDDITGITSLEGGALSSPEYAAIQRLQKDAEEHRIGQPIQQETYVDGELTAIQRTNFSTTSHLTLPSSIEAIYEDGTLEERLTYHDYDAYGNPLEVSKPDGSHTMYIWGYNGQYPIAKIENASYEGISTSASAIITSIQATSNIESTEAQENALRDLFEDLRSNAYFQNAMITSYTYDPLIGVTSITDPKGYTTYYEYDEFQRLRAVKDAEGHLLSTNVYNYKN